MKEKRSLAFIILACAVVCMFFICLFIGSARLSPSVCLSALFGRGEAADIRIVRNIRLPRALAALIAGASLSLAGLIMQTALHNPMASPSTLGVSDAAVFGANLSLLFFAERGAGVIFENAGGFSLYAAGFTAFFFSLCSSLLILTLCRLRLFSPGVLVLTGIAVGSIWTAATAVLQFYATDAGLSSAVIWSFGDLGRATYESDFLMLAVAVLSGTFFFAMRWRYNALLLGEADAKGLGVPVERIRFLSLLLASLLTSVCVSCLGIIGFVGILCPHIAKRLFGRNHSLSLPASALTGSLLLLIADALSVSIGKGSALPVGAVTSLFGAPFFLAVVIKERGKSLA